MKTTTRKIVKCVKYKENNDCKFTEGKCYGVTSYGEIYDDNVNFGEFEFIEKDYGCLYVHIALHNESVKGGSE